MVRFQRGQIVAAVSNLGTSYNLINFNLAHVMMQDQYGGEAKCARYVSVASSASMVGAIVGQLTFGYVGDCLGRDRALHLTQLLTIAGALLSAFAFPLVPGDEGSVFVFIALTRLLLGVGVGGVYPLSATISAESSSAATRGRSCALVFSMQGVGTLLVPLVGVVLVGIFGSPEARMARGAAAVGIQWRLLLALGAAPGLMLMLAEARRPSSQEQQGPAPTAPAAGASSTTDGLRRALASRDNWEKLIGCAGGWFLFDITFYGNTIFQPTVLHIIFKSGSGQGPVVDGGSLATNLCWQMVILALIGLPGYYVAIYFMERMGRKKIQIQGFVVMAVLYAVLAVALEGLEGFPVMLLIVYGLTYFFSNFGPNSTTFILPSETFPPEVRSTLNGVCAATGKVGATLGSALFKPLISAAGTAAAFWACAACAVLGVVLTAFFVRDMRPREAGLMQDVVLQGVDCQGAHGEERGDGRA